MDSVATKACMFNYVPLLSIATVYLNYQFNHTHRTALDCDLNGHWTVEIQHFFVVVVGGCLSFFNRLYILHTFQNKMIKSLHDGVDLMTSLAALTVSDH